MGVTVPACPSWVDTLINSRRHCHFLSTTVLNATHGIIGFISVDPHGIHARLG